MQNIVIFYLHLETAQVAVKTFDMFHEFCDQLVTSFHSSVKNIQVLSYVHYKSMVQKPFRIWKKTKISFHCLVLILTAYYR